MRLLLSILLFWGFVHGQSNKPNPSKDLKSNVLLEQEIFNLKEDIYRSKQSLENLKKTILETDLSKSKTTIDFKNYAGGLFELQKAEFTLDNELIYQVQNNGKLKEVERVFDEGLSPGEHQLNVRLTYKGKSKALEYYADQSFEVQKIQTFNVDFGKTTLISLMAIDKGYFKGEFKDRLTMEVKVQQDWGLEDSN